MAFNFSLIVIVAVPVLQLQMHVGLDVCSRLAPTTTSQHKLRVVESSVGLVAETIHDDAAERRLWWAAVVIGGLAFNIGNIAGGGLGLNALLGIG